MPFRMVHLGGGLRAFDDKTAKAKIQVSPDLRVADFATTTYPELYGQLRALGLQAIGVEFISADVSAGRIAPDWECASPSGGFKVREARIWWDGARHVANDSHLLDVVDLAARTSTYLGLLPIRILDLSRAYNQTLRAYRLDSSGETNYFFDNSFRPYIDAAIHAFVADAASFRDLLAEAAWRLVLNERSNVTKLKGFLKTAKDSAHPLAQAIISAGNDGGWLKVLSDLRNHITHAAPVGHASAFQFCQPRSFRLGEIEALSLHYPLLDEQGLVRQFPTHSQTTVSEGLAFWQVYKAYADVSMDALEYCWATLGKLVDLSSEIGRASGLKSETPVIRKDDLVGIPRVRLGERAHVPGH
jgi:hypothetical protein